MKTNNIEIEPNDLALAQRLLTLLMPLGYLFASMRQEHLCVDLEELESSCWARTPLTYTPKACKAVFEAGAYGKIVSLP